jgi:hypothetical protein
VLKKQGLIQEAFIEFHSKPNVGRFSKSFNCKVLLYNNIKHNGPCTVKLRGQSFVFENWPANGPLAFQGSLFNSFKLRTRNNPSINHFLTMNV